MGREFAARHAEGIFIAVHRSDLARKIVDDVRARAQRLGRDPQSLKFFAMGTVVTGADDAEALAMHEAYRKVISAEGHLARLSAILQIDLSRLDPDEPLEYVETQGIRSVLEIYTKLDPGRRWTPRAISEFLGISGGGAEFVGGPTRVADQMERWFDEAGIDGFNITDPMPLRTYPDFNRHVLPELRRRGRVREHYDGSTYRESLYGAGQKRAPDDHPASAYRRVAPPPSSNHVWKTA